MLKIYILASTRNAVSHCVQQDRVQQQSFLRRGLPTNQNREFWIRRWSIKTQMLRFLLA